MLVKNIKHIFTLAVLAVALGAVMALPVRAFANEGQLILDGPSVGDDDIELRVFKVDSDTKENLAGAHLQVINKDTGKVVASWTSDGSGPFVINKGATGEGLNDNTTYILREVSAPEGYEVAKDTEFTVTSGSDSDQGFKTIVSIRGKNTAAQMLAADGSAAQMQLSNAKTTRELEIEKEVRRESSRKPTSGKESGGDSREGEEERSGNGRLAQTGDEAPLPVVCVIGLVGCTTLAFALHTRKDNGE